MMSEQQRLEKYKKIMLVTRCFLETCGSIDEVSKITGVSKSSVQRYLKDPEILELFGQEIADEIDDILNERKKERASLGGCNFVRNNISLKREDGKFVGCIKR